MSVSLHKHIRRTYTFDQFSGGFVELLAAQETADPGTDWYQGTADAVRKNLRYVDQPNVDYVIVLSGDQLYRMDFRQLLDTHIRNQADVTIACKPVTRDEARGFGVMQLDDTGRVRGFVEKPQTDEEIDLVRTDPSWIDARGVKSRGRDVLASMGIYVFNKELLKEVLLNNEYADFGKEVFPQTISSHHVQMHLFDGYWEDIGTIRSFYDANLNLAADDPQFQLFTPEAPIYTRARFLPPTRMSGASVTNSLIANGCCIGRGAVIENCVVGVRTIIGADVTIRNSIIMGYDFYESGQAGGEPLGNGDDLVPMGIGPGAVIEGAIIDKNVRIGRAARVVNTTGRQKSSPDHAVCVIQDGIPVVIKNRTLADGWELDQEVG